MTPGPLDIGVKRMIDSFMGILSDQVEFDLVLLLLQLLMLPLE